MTEQGETGEAITILLVEDDAPTCWRLQDALVKAGYEVRTAGSLGEARSALASDDETPYPGLDPNAIPEPRDNDPENDDDAPRGEGGKE